MITIVFLGASGRRAFIGKYFRTSWRTVARRAEVHVMKSTANALSRRFDIFISLRVSTIIIVVRSSFRVEKNK